ncbi:hypothetical protein HY502_03065, partial [Candidatus Woesebacteria bacterium]|nr:hypothetical protein [Candidatus Woesebacteria bacterium]
IDGKKVPNRAEAFTGGTRILFKEQKVEEIIIRVLKTQGGDSAFINELDFIPAGFDDINPVLADEVREFPIKKIKTQVELSELREYLENGTKACLRWLNKYGQKEKEFFLSVDGIPHRYKIPIPALGTKNTNFVISCTNFPVDITPIFGSVSF